MSDLIERTKPTEAGLGAAWGDDAREQVLARVLAEPARAGSRGRPWLLAVAASLLAAVLLVTPAMLPGWFARNATADELAKVAETAGAQSPLEWGPTQFLRVRTMETQSGMLESDGQASSAARQVTYDDFHTTDGWTWSDRVVNGESQRYIFPPAWGWLRPDYAAGMPTDPHLLDLFLRARAVGSTSADEAVFVAIGDMLRQEAAPPKVRAAAIGVLGLNPKVTVVREPDPRGRAALKVMFVDEARRPQSQQVLYLAPDTGLLLATSWRGPGFTYGSVVTDRGVVDALPDDLLRRLGSEKVGKEVIAESVRLLPAAPGSDPVPAPRGPDSPPPVPRPGTAPSGGPASPTPQR